MKKAIIFCTGFWGKILFGKFAKIFDIVAYSDNNKQVWGSVINDVPVLSPDELKGYTEDCSVIICNANPAKSLFTQMYEIGFKDVLFSRDGTIYDYAKGALLPVRYNNAPYKKTNEQFSVLFVQPLPCPRTKRMAQLLKDNDVFTAIAYTMNTPKSDTDSFANCFDKEYPIFSYDDLIDFVNNSEFDVVHSSNEPDNLTNILLFTNKKIIHDTHDMMSICKSKIDYNDATFEYIANTQSAGLMYTTEGIFNVAKQKFNVEAEKTFIISNLPYKEFPVNNLAKLSKKDGELHCVYEGGISFEPNHPKFFENQWAKITEAGIHVHFYPSQYSIQNIDYFKNLEKQNKYLHYEGTMDSLSELVNEMTKYDIGLLILELYTNDNMNVKLTSANKLFEYLNAGLPVAVDGIGAYSNTAIENNVGMAIDFNEDLYSQFEKLKQIVVPDNFISENKFTIESRTQEILDFYKKIANS